MHEFSPCCLSATSSEATVFGQNVNEQLMCSCLEPNLLSPHSTESCCFDFITVVCCYSIDSNSLPSCLFYTDELLTRLHTPTSLGLILGVHFEKDVKMLLFFCYFHFQGMNTVNLIYTLLAMLRKLILKHSFASNQLPHIGRN